MLEFDGKCIYPLINNQYTMYLSFIDDISILWINLKSEKKTLMNKANQKQPVDQI